MATDGTTTKRLSFVRLCLPQNWVVHPDVREMDGSVRAVVEYLAFQIQFNSEDDGRFNTKPTALATIAHYCGLDKGTVCRALQFLRRWKPDGLRYFLQVFEQGGGRESNIYQFNFLALIHGEAKHARRVAPAQPLPLRPRGASSRAGATDNNKVLRQGNTTTAVPAVPAGGETAVDAVVFQVLKGMGLDEAGIAACASYPQDRIERARDYTMAAKARLEKKGRKMSGIAGYFRQCLTEGWAERPAKPSQKAAAPKATPPAVQKPSKPASKPAEAEIDTSKDFIAEAKRRLKAAPAPVPVKRRYV